MTDNNINKCMISVIIPIFKKPSVLQFCLEGLYCAICHTEQRTHKGIIEVIIVDNNSCCEKVSTLLLNYQEKIHMLSVVYQPKLEHTFALCKARNTALKLAKGDRIVSLDSDCVVNVNYFNTILGLNCVDQYTGERVFVSERTIDRDSNIIEWDKLPHFQSPSNYGLSTDRRFPQLSQLDDGVDHPWAYVHAASWCFNKDHILAVGGFDERYDGHWGYEDYDASYRMAQTFKHNIRFHVGLKVYHVDDKLTDPVPCGTSRVDRKQNPNWKRICRLIPGFENFKEKQYNSFYSV